MVTFASDGRERPASCPSTISAIVLVLLEGQHFEQFLLLRLTYSLARVHNVHLQHVLLVIEASFNGDLAVVSLFERVFC